MKVYSKLNLGGNVVQNLKNHASDIFLKSVIIIFITVITFICLVPFMMVISSSFNDEIDTLRYGYPLIPRVFSLDSYYSILSRGSYVFSSYRNTVFVTVVGTLLSAIITTMLAYGLSRRYLPGVKILNFFIYFPMVFSGGIIPWYIVVRSLGLRNTIWSMIIPVLVNPWNVFLVRSFFGSIPPSIHESAKLDGAGEFMILFRIVYPLSMPILATVSLFYGVAYWNDWFNALMFVDKRELYPLQLLLREILTTAQAVSAKGISMQGKMFPTEGVKMATAVVSMGPILLLYPYVQKYFIKGITIGAVKG